MNTQKYNWILYLISTTIVITIVVQLYWNYNNYLDNKQRVKNDIQSSLDISIEEYYTNLSKSNFFGVFSADSIETGHNLFESLTPSGRDSSKSKFTISSIQITTDDPDEYRDMPALLDSIIFKDSLLTAKFNNRSQLDKGSNLDQTVQIIDGRRQADSLKVIRGIQSVVIALKNDGVNFDEFDSIFDHQLNKKGINASYYAALLQNDSVVGKSGFTDKGLTLFANSKSTYLRPDQVLRVYYEDPSLIALKKSSTGILLSLLLSTTVVLSLFYLLKIIRKQKELAEIKNDLISNITHEFKTPIATVSTAIEAIENFNVLDDKEKTKKYLSMSSVQLKKLHQMVEKLLETATLDSEKLILKKEPVDLVDLISRIAKKHEILTNKNISFSSNIDSKTEPIDLFHMENSISNLVDNAIKYGGENIELNINSVLNNTIISVADDGKGIEKNQQERIFDKFYRVPKGNRHDVKGFGIGLYYTKKIVEKHGGTIGLTSQAGSTVFNINIPND
jgi:two-component system phosphate regulon sensor histidine kinase PhoR